MKQQDIALIIVIMAISAGISFFASSMIFASGKHREQTVSKIDPISADFTIAGKNYVVSSKYFNDKSINPTQMIQIGDQVYDQPFGGGQ